jgi:hypothetical protein
MNATAARRVAMMPTSDPLFFAFAGALLVMFVVAANYLAPLVFKYRFTDAGFETRAFRVIPIVRIPFASIIEVRIVNAREIWFPSSLEMFNAARAGNRLFVRRAVVIRRATGLRRLVVVTPSNPGAFVQHIEAHLGSGAAI